MSISPFGMKNDIMIYDMFPLLGGLGGVPFGDEGVSHDCTSPRFHSEL